MGDEQTVVVPQQQQHHQQQTAEQQGHQQGETTGRRGRGGGGVTAGGGREERWRRRGAEMEPQTETFEFRSVRKQRHGPGNTGVILEVLEVLKDPQLKIKNKTLVILESGSIISLLLLFL